MGIESGNGTLTVRPNTNSPTRSNSVLQRRLDSKQFSSVGGLNQSRKRLGGQRDKVIRAKIKLKRPTKHNSPRGNPEGAIGREQAGPISEQVKDGWEITTRRESDLFWDGVQVLQPGIGKARSQSPSMLNNDGRQGRESTKEVHRQALSDVLGGRTVQKPVSQGVQSTTFADHCAKKTNAEHERWSR
jgi:hypothetical protein